MFTLVIGGAASGKSEYAEAHVETLPGRRLYIATMEPWDEECRARIARHQAARAHKRFTTVECYRNLSQLTVPPDSNVLLECLGNLVANERYGRHRLSNIRQNIWHNHDMSLVHTSHQKSRS